TDNTYGKQCHGESPTAGRSCLTPVPKLCLGTHSPAKLCLRCRHEKQSWKAWPRPLGHQSSVAAATCDEAGRYGQDNVIPKQRREPLRFPSVLSAQSAVNFFLEDFAQPRSRSGLLGGNLGAADKGGGLIHDQTR